MTEYAPVPMHDVELFGGPWDGRVIRVTIDPGATEYHLAYVQGGAIRNAVYDRDGRYIRTT